MRSKIFLCLILVCSIAVQGQIRTLKKASAIPMNVNSESSKAVSNTLPIKRVIVYSNGVAYIERRGFVSGNAEINLSFKQSQVDDVLKSMVVLDLGQGRIGAVSYNSSAPPSAKMAEIPFSVDAVTDGINGGLAGVLAQLQGAKVLVSANGATAVGSILTVEKREVPADKDKPARQVRFLVIASDNGEISSFDLSEVRSIKLLENGTVKDVNEFANATASARRRDAKTITVTSDGSGQREMIVSYTIAAPIWKTTYRVVMDEQGKPFFQGWAIVDNVSDEDWRDVQLSLVSGTPISFIQPIQQPFFRYRPIVPIPNDLKLRPQVYEDGVSSNYTTNSISGIVTDPNGAVIPNTRVTIRNNSTGYEQTLSTDSQGNFQTGQLDAGNYTVSASASGFQNLRVTNVQVGSGQTNNLRLSLSVGSVSETVDVTSSQVQSLPLNGRNTQSLLQLNAGSAQSNFMTADGTNVGTSLSNALTTGKSGVETAATGEEIGDLFEYKIAQPVTVMRDRSALIPIVQTKMDGERVSIYNEAVRRDRPMGGMKLVNTTSLTLEGGSLTVLDGNAYAGEALMERLKPKEQRFISYALDLGTLVTVRQDADSTPAKLIKILNGVFQVHYFRQEHKTYTIQNQTERPRVVYIEYPVRQGWQLTDETPKPEITTQRYYRYKVELGAYAKKEFTVAEQQALMDSYALTNLSRADLEMFLTRRYINAETKQRLEKLIDLRIQINQIDAKIQSFEDEEEKISDDQKRLRENIEALSKTPEAKTLIARYITKANEQETRLEAIEIERKALGVERQRLEAELSAAIRAFNV
ncbi:MAG TPA: carboxypeptidase regulatory-like domain-containing protein [Pyrinomonadaceae bacterium]